MELDVLRLTADYYHKLLDAELHINEWVQDRLFIAEPFFRFVSVYLEPSNLFNVLIPLLGICGQDLLTHLVCALSLVSAVSSFEKWIYPDWRPLWRLRELYANEYAIRPGVALQSHDLSCETSGGLPCAHSMAWTALLMVVSMHLPMKNRSSSWRLTMYGLIGCCILSMWLSRLYLATEYLHQCLLSTYLAISLLASCQRHLNSLYSRRCSWAVLMVLLLGCLAMAVYFLKLHLDIDPHWSVRQAFKWCSEPTYMRHESSPIFLLARDLGNLMGVALALPVEQIRNNNSKYSHRFVGIAIVELLNYILRLGTPKQHGRFLFLAYEFIRNALHSLILVKLLPKLLCRKS
ncbi:PREDICTED: glucose-6-phosphatase [Drosophila arizonae]|uniref:glucose-6-phosphatase n=1 Tax=Drosophila arizonae TaxID=7263 RepID=A0ABM1NP46_DROAR|nr:PREDICTED: glucose-6-phosphatase [Drosophila arizonae]